jgi:hypothetical protein
LPGRWASTRRPRAPLCAAGRKTKDGRYAKVERDSDAHTELCLFLEENMDGVVPPKTK